ncbi:MAG: hypothetical protein N3B16_05495 [Candidatus Aminicenantes bacterium]|nr:hypothetical protein [Candidatus Aminicenantes bacterium]
MASFLSAFFLQTANSQNQQWTYVLSQVEEIVMPYFLEIVLGPDFKRGQFYS